MANALPAPAITASGLRKSFGDQVVLDGMDLEVPAGTIFSLLGPNGSGKTTTVRILSTLLPADGGEASVAGHDLRRDARGVRSAIAVTGQFSAVDKLLTGRENLLLMGRLGRLSRRDARARAGELLERFDLVDAADRYAATYSGGMKRRLDLAMSLVGRPGVIFLDEPTTGLDPRSRRTMWEIIRELVAEGATIFLTTQQLEEADRLADRIGVLDRGGLVAEGTPEELKSRIPGGHVSLQFADQSQLEAAAEAVEGGTPDHERLTLQVPSDGGVDHLRSLLDRLAGLPVTVEKLAIHTADLDDVFFALTGREGEQAGSAQESEEVTTP
ncbi:ATP-binding cassette domain-containing protein [Actinomadura bangladeshensis]|uniref:ATP-binding cassette domain-containing protein n=1 Tax=Actinomadura bangladeshensis TaxID=453573 RepID=A0A6L9QQK7_9ACTN|nr:ATP-binding cassette domain-containing protein [Actinomadura bangladeshensis]NEA27376.1 ATP-binding cassette domain-containing protein [Actinomadura bangladeshensis]